MPKKKKTKIKPPKPSDALLDVLQRAIIRKETITIGVGKTKYQAYVTYMTINQDCPGGVEELTFKMAGRGTELDGQPDVNIAYVRKPL
jgi:hypothetical protein